MQVLRVISGLVHGGDVYPSPGRSFPQGPTRGYSCALSILSSSRIITTSPIVVVWLPPSNEEIGRWTAHLQDLVENIEKTKSEVRLWTVKKSPKRLPEIPGWREAQ